MEEGTTITDYFLYLAKQDSLNGTTRVVQAACDFFNRRFDKPMFNLDVTGCAQIDICTPDLTRRVHLHVLIRDNGEKITCFSFWKVGANGYRIEETVQFYNFAGYTGGVPVSVFNSDLAGSAQGCNLETEADIFSESLSSLVKDSMNGEMTLVVAH